VDKHLFGKTPTTAGVVVGGNREVRFHGYLLTETAGSAVTVTLYTPTDAVANVPNPPAPDATGTVVAVIVVPANGLLAMGPGPIGVLHKNGLFAKVSGSGTLAGQIFYS
jgi:hypothetical protein